MAWCRFDEKLHEICIYVILVIYGLASILHILGLFGLFCYKQNSNQKVILIQLSTVELLLSVTGLILRTDELQKYLTITSDIVIDSIEQTAIFELVLTMNILTMDRLICILHPLKYKCRITKTRLSIIILSSWVISVILPVVRIFLWEANEIYIFTTIALGACFVLLAIVTYSIVFYKMRHSNRLFASSTGRHTTSRKQFLIPGTIIVTFILLYTIPFIIFRTAWSSVVSQLNPSEEDCLLASRAETISRVFMCFGLLTDPVTYIFLSKSYRRAILTFCKNQCCFCQQNMNEVSTNTIVLNNFDNPYTDR